MVVDCLADPAADRIFHALADSTRRDIIALTVEGEHSVSALARRYPMSFAAVQKHVAVLESAGLVTKQRRGREQIVRTNIATIERARRLLDEIEALWRSRVARIDELLATDGPAAVARSFERHAVEAEVAGEHTAHPHNPRGER